MSDSFSDAECRLLAELFGVFANATRIRLLCALNGGRKGVSELAAYADVSLHNASQHLRIMRDKGAMKTQKQGQHVYYAIADKRFLQVARLMRSALGEVMQGAACSLTDEP